MSEHVSLNVEESNLPVNSRKSFKRYWKQLSRCQRNLIISAFLVLFMTCFLFLNFGHYSGSKHLKLMKRDSTESATVDDDLETNRFVVPPPNDVDEKIEIRPENIPKGFPQVESQLQPELVIRQKIEPIKFSGPRNARQRAVVEAFKHSWKGYKEYAWGHDNFKPISKTFYDWFALGLTIVDSLDTLYIMNLKNEFQEARDWVEEHLLFNQNRYVNLFEVTIRVLGGLLSSYHLSGDEMFLHKAIGLGNRLLPCFNSPSGVPYSDVNLKQMIAQSPTWLPDSSTSEVTTLQLEFRDLSRSCGNSSFENAASAVNMLVHKLEKQQGLVPIFINPKTGKFRNFATVTLGARGDSYYEYLIKQWIQTGKDPKDYLIEDYKISIDGVLKNLVRKTAENHYTFIGELINGKDFKPKMDHLTCYLPGILLLGHSNGMPDSHLKLGNELMETCLQTYFVQPTGLAPEISYFTEDTDSNMPDIYVKAADSHSLLRPEFIESLYYYYAITGNKTYQDWGWTIFKSFIQYTRVENGFTSIGNVQNPSDTRPRDMMESFWLGETLKYFYLLFSDDRKEIDLDKYVFNTEAHPLPIFNN